jgi:hypothetical protein
MQKQDEPSNLPEPLAGQGGDEVVVKTALSDNDNDDDNVQTFTFSSTEEGAAAEEGTDVQEDVNGQTRDLLSEEVSSTAERLPLKQGSTARDQPISICHQAFPGLWETQPVDRETPRQSKPPTATSSVESSGRQSQTIEFDDGEMWPRPS